MNLAFQIPSTINITLSLLIETLKNSTSQILSNLREFPETIKNEIHKCYTLDVQMEEVLEDSLEAEEQAIYGYSA